uniref:uncharacterized protein n=1 Tax=Centroberyx gerrardi TaxID=166262 RepID=UPI003AAB0102
MNSVRKRLRLGSSKTAAAAARTGKTQPPAPPAASQNEPKMTRSKFKEVVEKGVVIPAWNISPIKKSSELNKAPQFVDIPLAEEDSSDEEYRPDEEEEDETAEDTFQESDMESTASSPRGSRVSRVEEESCSPWRSSRQRSRRQRAGSVSMGPPPPPQAPPPRAVTDSTFLEKLHAVEEELAVCMEPYQILDEVGLMAYRTRSKRPLRDVPLGRLEAELRAPDITPDMYDSGSAPEDRDWTDWLRGLMSSDVENEEECDDEDDPEYNFLADIDEPDQEDYRDDKAVRITKKEVNELMEELFETLKEDLAGQDLDDEGHEEEEEPQEETHTHRNDGSWACRHTHTQHTHCPEPYTLRLDGRQKARLQQQLQQHVQLLTQINLLCSPVDKLHSEAETTRQFLFELDLLAQRGEVLTGLLSCFRASNLQAALQLLEELRQRPVAYRPRLHRPDALGRMRYYPVMPAELAWLFATRPVFLYPELLPCCSLDPALYCPRRTAAFTAAEDCLLVLGLRNMEGSSDPTKLVSQFLLRKTLVQIRRRILQCCRPGFPDNIVKAYRYQQVLWSMPVACGRVDPADRRPPVEREESVLPAWLARSLPVIYPSIKQFNGPSGSAPRPVTTAKLTRSRRSHRAFLRPGRKCGFPAGTRLPPRLPAGLELQRMGFVFVQQPDASRGLPGAPPPAAVVSDQLIEPSSWTDPPPSSPSRTPPPSNPPEPCAQTPPPSRSQITQNPPRILLSRLLPSAGVEGGGGGGDSPSAAVSSTRERINSYYRMFAGLRKRPRSPRLPPPPGADGKENCISPPPPPPLPSEDKSTQTGRPRRRRDDEGGGEGPASCQLEGGAVVMVKEEEEEKEEEEDEEEEECGDVQMPLLALSESEEEQEVMLTPPSPTRREGEEDDDDEDGGTSSDESTLSVPELQETMEKLSWLVSDGAEEEEEDEEDEGVERQMEDLAQDYLRRVCDAVLAAPSRADRLLEELERFAAGGAGGGARCGGRARRGAGARRSTAALFRRLSGVLRPWPQLIRDFAAFLNPDQARRCGLLAEQQLFERSRRFLRQLGRSLGEGSSHYQEVVSVLQGSSAPRPEDMEKISSLLKDHTDLQEEFWEFFHQLHTQPSPTATQSETRDANSVSHNPTDRTRKRDGAERTGESESRTGSDGEEGEEEEEEEEWRGREEEEERRGGGEGEEEEREERPSLSSDRPVCAKNISLSSTGQKVVLWTREADRAILTACQRRGANQKTFRLVATQLGNKTANQVSSRFHDLMSLFRSATQKHTQPISRQEAAPD